MSMERLIAEHFGRAPAQQSQEDFEKNAQFELFAKLAAENNVDLSQYSNEQIQYLINETFSDEGAKTAAEEPKDEKKEEKDKDKAPPFARAKEEHEKKKEAAAEMAKFAEYGAVMARSFLSTLAKEAEEKDKDKKPEAKSDEDKEKEASEKIAKGLDKVRHLFGKAREVASSGAARAELSGARKAHEATGGADSHVAERLRRAHSGAMASGGKNLGRGAMAAGGAAALAGTAAVATSKKEKEKKSSAMDEVAAELAVVKAAEAGFDPEQAGELIAARLLLGVEESVKIASHINELTAEQAVEIRSLELLEAVGYPVDWA